MLDFEENTYKNGDNVIDTKIIFIKLVALSIAIVLLIQHHSYDTKIKSPILTNFYEKNNQKKNYPFKGKKFNNPYIPQGNNKCEKYDPFNLFKIRFKSDPIYLCKSDNSEHLCYINHNALSIFKKGVTCKMSNFVLNTSNWKPELEENTYQDSININNSFLSKGFFKMKFFSLIEIKIHLIYFLMVLP